MYNFFLRLMFCRQESKISHAGTDIPKFSNSFECGKKHSTPAKCFIYFNFYTIICMYLFPDTMDISQLYKLTSEEIDVKDENGETWLMKAARTKNPQTATELIQHLISKGADVNITSSWHHYSALWHAVNTNCRESVKLLLNAQANPNIGHPPIVIAARYGDNKNFVPMLLEAGAGVNLTDDYGSMLRMAAFMGNYETIKRGLAAGAKVNNTYWQFMDPIDYNESALMLLFAAGDNIRYFHSNSAPNEILKIKLDRSLANLCRQRIRNCLTTSRPQQNMFALIESLPLPELLKKFLLYNMSL